MRASRGGKAFSAGDFVGNGFCFLTKKLQYEQLGKLM